MGQYQACGSSLAQALLPVFEQRREQITDNPALSRLNLDSDGHSGRQVHSLVLHLHLRAIERNARRVVQLLSFRLAGGFLAAGSFAAVGLLVARNGVLGNPQHRAVEQPVAREVERIDLDLRRLAGLHEADVTVGDHRLDFQVALLRNEDQQGLRRGDDAADGVNSQLLYDAVDRCGHYLKPHLLFRLDQGLSQAPGLALGFGQFSGTRAAELGDGLLPGCDERADCRLRLLNSALLYFQLLLLLDLRLEDFEVVPFRADPAVVERLANVDSLVQDREGGFDLFDGRRSSGALGFFLSLLPL